MSNNVINVVVARQLPSGTLVTDQPVTLRTVSTIASTGNGGGGAETLLELLDVASNSSIANGSTIVYYASNSTFVVEPLPLVDVANLDCGTF